MTQQEQDYQRMKEQTRQHTKIRLLEKFLDQKVNGGENMHIDDVIKKTEKVLSFLYGENSKDNFKDDVQKISDILYDYSNQERESILENVASIIKYGTKINN